MDCEICGRNSSDLYLISVEGTRLTVCSDCSSCGTFISKVEERPLETTRIIEEEPEIDLVDNYAELIRGARAKASLTQEELAKKINENFNVIKKVEKGELAPTEKLSKKLEKLFRIRLFQPVKKERLEKKKVETSLSLEDVAIIKK
jgi:putative transcription factor